MNQMRAYATRNTSDVKRPPSRMTSRPAAFLPPVGVLGTRRLTPRQVVDLQRTIGNAAVSRLLGAAHQDGEPAEVQRATVDDVLGRSGRPLTTSTRQEMEARLGADFSAVRIHDDSVARRSAATLSARAYTRGNDIVLGDDGADKHILAHELVHVVQQRGPVAGSDSGHGLQVSDSGDRFERAAEATATRALSAPVCDVGAAEAVRRGAVTNQPGTIVQRYLTGQPYIQYGGTNTHGVGRWMHAELHPGQNLVGSVPSVSPAWWPTGNTPTAAWFSTYMVQGHLLNQKLGGPGDTMENLTPIARSTNTLHHNRVEAPVKNYVNNGCIVEYYVEPNYSTHPTAATLMTNADPTVATDINTNFANLLAGSLRAEYTVYDPTTGAEVSGAGDAWEIENGGSHMTGLLP